MNITFTDTSNIQARAKKMKPLAQIPFSHPSSPVELSPININQERPFKTNSQNLSFEGLSSYDGFEKAIKSFKSEFGETAEKTLREKIQKANLSKDSGLTLNGDKITFSEKSFGKRFLELIVYPVAKMPIDIANSVLTSLQKAPGLKNAKFLKNVLETKALKNRRTFLENTSDVAGIQHYFEIFKSGKPAFKDGHMRLNPLVSNYDSTTERTLTRIVTGAIPAFYLANDAYNLSIYMNNDKSLAKKDKKRRFNQELARIGVTAGATFGVLSLFSKKSNASGAMTVVLMSGLTFVSEIVGRMMAGTPVLPVSEKSAKKYAKKQGRVVDSLKDSSKQDPRFSSNSAQKVKKPEEKQPKDGKLTLKNFFKLFGLLAVAGFGVEKVSGQKNVKKVLTELNNKYKNLYRKDFTISRKDFSKVTDKLRKEGFAEMADNYEKIIKGQKGDLIKIGKRNDKVRFTLIHQILTFPVRFAWSTLMAPYSCIVKPLANIIIKGGKKLLNIKTNELVNKAAKEKEADNKTKQMLQNSLLFLKKNENNPNYKEKVSGNIVASLDNVTKSNHDNADLSAIIKNTMSAITSAFLIADNYNLVMIDSGGKDKDLAEQKAKERTIQRGARLAYGAFLVKFLNGVFAKQYNSSLLGAQAVNTVYAVATESLERTSVGLPLTQSTHDEIVAKEKKNLNAKGFKGGYFKFMAKLTGKKAVSQKKTTAKV